MYNGSWVFVEPARVPGALVHLPHDFRHVPPGHQRIKYVDVKNNWKTWEKEKHWDKREVKKDRNGGPKKGHKR